MFFYTYLQQIFHDVKGLLRIQKEKFTFKLKVRQEINDSVDDVFISYPESSCGGTQHMTSAWENWEYKNI